MACPEISDEVMVQTREDGDNQVIGRDVGQISPIELHEASLEENRARARVGLPPKPREPHPDGHKRDEDDGNDFMYGPRAPLAQRKHFKKKIALGRGLDCHPNLLMHIQMGTKEMKMMETISCLDIAHL
jgi:hypothetical protein